MQQKYHCVHSITHDLIFWRDLFYGFGLGPAPGTWYALSVIGPYSGIRNVVKPCVGPIDFFFGRCVSYLLGTIFIDSKYKEWCNCCADLIRIQSLTLGMLPVSPTTGYQRNRQTKEWIMWGQWRQAYTQTRALYAMDTPEVRSKIDRFDTCNGNAKSARDFPGVPESTVWCLQNKLSTAYPTGGHVTRLEHHRRGRPVLLGAVVHQQEQT